MFSFVSQDVGVCTFTYVQICVEIVKYVHIYIYILICYLSILRTKHKYNRFVSQHRIPVGVALVAVHAPKYGINVAEIWYMRCAAIALAEQLTDPIYGSFAFLV